MLSFYCEVRNTITNFLQDACPGYAPCVPDTDCACAEASLPLGYHPPPEGGWLPLLNSRLEAVQPALDGVPLFNGISESRGHVLFHVSSEAYSRAMQHIIENCPLPDLPQNTDDPVDYATARMLMLRREAGRGCPDDPKVKRALWLAFGIQGFDGKKREAMRRRAAAALIEITAGIKPSDQREAVSALGSVGDCAARLLALFPDQGGLNT